MERPLSTLIVIAALALSLAHAQEAAQRLVYADFEQLNKDKHPVSARGGRIIFDVTAQNDKNKPTVSPKLFGAQAPLTQRIAFEYELKQPNDWATAYIKILGFKDKGYTAGEVWERQLLAKAEDLSDYKFLTLDIGAVGTEEVRIDLISESNGIDTNAFPSFNLKVNNQLQPYRIPLTDFKQPEGSWVTKKVTTSGVLKKLTSVQINVSKVPSKGIVVLDNLAFEK